MQPFHPFVPAWLTGRAPAQPAAASVRTDSAAQEQLRAVLASYRAAPMPHTPRRSQAQSFRQWVTGASPSKTRSPSVLPAPPTAGARHATPTKQRQAEPQSPPPVLAFRRAPTFRPARSHMSVAQQAVAAQRLNAAPIVSAIISATAAFMRNGLRQHLLAEIAHVQAQVGHGLDVSEDVLATLQRTITIMQTMLSTNNPRLGNDVLRIMQELMR